MADDKYLFMLRWNGDLPDGKVSVGAKLAKLLLGFIRGDSLDTPFVNFIPVTGFNHSVGSITDEKSYSDLKKATSYDWKDSYRFKADEEADTNAFGTNAVTQERVIFDNQRLENPDWQWTGATPTKQTEPGMLKGNLPDHSHVTFTKRVDSATPQLAYGCTTQEQFKVALFYFRRKVGFNVAAVPFPYLVVGLENVVVRNWELDGDKETVKLSYDRICWGAISQWADTPVPQGLTTRIFDRTTGTGGLMDKSALTGFVVGFTGIIYTAAWATVGATTGQGVQ